ncbi:MULTISPECIES: SDR family NAD(P)-dependent oxidoreductase [Paenibacillus]|uniref:Oxidoreductase n=1 Tax=Paenibacillus albilobatus TaxID=2716884 RepID=A0A919XPC7_9BACL|nr:MULTISPECIES: SDR family oxidoreductase [Paenibacillus]MDR9856713.1 SDR family oxidoreductase [Paenibacillus sp. VCA1]GIO33813.1 oxidoreductase [Paenibacillus albilobatus]
MLKDKVVLITGASSGIGLLTAQMLSEKGAVPVLAARSESKLAEASGRIAGKHGIRVLDVTSEEEVRQTVEETIRDFGGIDILLNNAGYGKFEAATDMPSEEFGRMMDVNYMGTVRCTKAVLPHMLERRSGLIVNVASMAGKIGTAKSTAYTATKHAVLGFSNALRQELRGTGVAVSTVNPGPIDTPFFDIADPSGGYVSSVKWLMMKPEHVARKMVRLMETGKEELNLPLKAAAAMRLYQLFPRLSDRLTYRMMNKK